MTEAKLMLKKGVSEVVLTGVNLGTYESEKKEFLELIHALSKLNGLKRLRISSIEPTTIPEEIFDLMADPSHCLMPYLHVPLQSGCDSILKKMRRKYSLSDMSQFFERASSKIPNLCLGTDLMVGFPGESRKDFEKTCETFMDFPFNYCHVFTFSERDGTPAAKMDDQVAMNERRERSAYLRRLSASKRMGFHESQVGRELRVLIENPKNQQFSGYSDNYVKIIVSEGFEKLSNKISIVKILEARPEYVVGQWVKFEN